MIADEPTGDLDSETTAEIMGLFASIKREGTSILMVTHELDLLQDVDRCYVMESGHLSEMTDKMKSEKPLTAATSPDE